MILYIYFFFIFRRKSKWKIWSQSRRVTLLFSITAKITKGRQFAIRWFITHHFASIFLKIRRSAVYSSIFSLNSCNHWYALGAYNYHRYLTILVLIDENIWKIFSLFFNFFKSVRAEIRPFSENFNTSCIFLG